MTKFEVGVLRNVTNEIIRTENDLDEDFVNDLRSRSKSFINGSAITYSWEETKRQPSRK